MSQQTDSALVRLGELAEEPYSSVLCYPAGTDEAELRSRIRELGSIGVEGIIFEGRSKIGSLGVLGKGCVGVVVKAVLGGSENIALKIRRMDADRESMEREAGFLRIANTAHVGPKLFASSKNFLAAALVDGSKIIDWIKLDREPGEIRSVALEVLEQCFRLDRVGLDHGELSNLNKHVIIDSKLVTIIDFESASTERRRSNVTSAAQCLFIGSSIALKVREALGILETNEPIRALKEYKDDSSQDKFESVLGVLGLRKQ